MIIFLKDNKDAFHAWGWFGNDGLVCLKLNLEMLIRNIFLRSADFGAFSPKFLTH